MARSQPADGARGCAAPSASLFGAVGRESYRARNLKRRNWIALTLTCQPLAGSRPRHRPLPEGLSFLDEPTLEGLTQFSPDMGPLPAEVNRLNNQVLVHYYEEEWRRWN